MVVRFTPSGSEIYIYPSGSVISSGSGFTNQLAIFSWLDQTFTCIIHVIKILVLISLGEASAIVRNGE